MYAVPIVAVVTAVIKLHEPIHVLQMVGAGVIFFGIYLIRRGKQLSLDYVEASSGGLSKCRVKIFGHKLRKQFKLKIPNIEKTILNW